MKFYKPKTSENKTSQENLKLITEIISDEINNVCFECGIVNPEFISLNNAVFLCSTCAEGHNKFPKEISTIIPKDFTLLSTEELKYVLIGGNKTLIEFINFEYPELKHCPPIFYTKPER